MRALPVLLSVLAGAVLFAGPALPSAQADVAVDAADSQGVVSEPAITAAGAVLWDADDERVLYDREAETGRPMASTTKIMTVLLAIEAGTAGDTVTVSPAAAALGEATLNLRAGQQVPMESLIAGLLLRSGNDAALAVAEHVAGSEAAFVQRMNERAAELGLAETHFVNPTGLTNDPAHRASPLDLARLAHEAMRHEVFARYAGAASFTAPGVGPMVSRNELLGVYPGATGVKTGYTRLAGLSLVASAARGDRTLYAVVLGSDDSFADTAALLDHGFDAFRRVELGGGGELTRYRWADAEVGVALDGTLARTVEVEEPVTWRTRLEPLVARPLEAGTRLGEAELRAGGEVVAVSPLVAAEPVAAPADGPPAGRVGHALQDALRAYARTAEIDRVVPAASG